MLDIKNPEINVDEIMQRIQEKVRLRQAQSAPANGAPSPSPAQSPLVFNQLLAQARDSAEVGVTVPPMTRIRGLKRAIAAWVAKIFLRLAQLITRDQRVFNRSIVAMIDALVERLGQHQLHVADELRRDRGQFREVETAFRGQLGEVDGRLRQLANDGREHGLELSRLRASLTLQERRLTLLLEEAKRRLSDPFDAKQLQSFADQLPRVADARYLHFEDAFRGAREDICRRVSVYVPKFREAGAGTEQSPILDLGCGRGELIEVLRSEGLKARGVDENEAAVEACRALQLDVTRGDMFETLRKLADGSLGGLTALHVVEHLPYPLVLLLLDEALRVLQPGGLLVLETPNPMNILVGASTFYVDPTHRNPVHPQTLRYLCEARGFVQVDTLMLHPYGAEIHVAEDSDVARRFNQYFHGPQDYAVLARRP